LLGFRAKYRYLVATKSFIMKKIYAILNIVVLLLLTATAFGQSSSFSALIQTAPADATKLLNAYGEPLFKGIGTGLNSGWYNSAKADKLLHFDLRVSVSSSFVPNSDKTFDVTQIGLSNSVRPDNPSETIAQTFGGSSNVSGPVLDVYDNNGQKVGSFTMPSGKLSFVPAPQVQLTIGLVKNTDITVRAIPTVSIQSEGSVSSIGVGIRHDLIQDFAGKTVSKIVPFDLAIAAGYSRLNMNIPLSVQPQDGAEPANSSQSTDFSNQHIAAAFNNLMVQLILSKKIAFFTPFGAVGYNNTRTTFNAVGNYPVTTGSSDPFGNGSLNGGTTYTTFRADLGFQLTPGFFRIYVSGSLAAYKSINGGIGFGF
jgi:hypothetical protein